MLLTYGENIMNYMNTTLLNLHSNDREDFHCDPIELIEATPGTSLGKTHEDIPARLVVHLLATVEHIDHDADCSAQVLRRLSLASTSRTLRRPAHHQMQGLREGDVAPGQVSISLCFSHLSVKGVITKRGVLPRYSWLYRNWASQMFAKQSSSTLSHLVYQDQAYP